MNILQQQDALKNFSKDQLVNEMQRPSGQLPQFLVLSELKRRQKMEMDYKAMENMPTSTVAEDAVASAGVPADYSRGMAQSMAPRSDVVNNTGLGAIKMQDGGRVGWSPGLEVYDPRLMIMRSDGPPRIPGTEKSRTYNRADLYRTRSLDGYEPYGRSPEATTSMLDPYDMGFGVLTEPGVPPRYPVAADPRQPNEYRRRDLYRTRSLDDYLPLESGPEAMSDVSAPSYEMDSMDYPGTPFTGYIGAKYDNEIGGMAQPSGEDAPFPPMQGPAMPGEARFFYNPRTGEMEMTNPMRGAAARAENQGKAWRDWRELFEKGIPALEGYGKWLHADPRMSRGTPLTSEDTDLLPPSTQAATESSGGLSFGELEGDLPEVIGPRADLSFGEPVPVKEGVGSPSPSPSGGGGGLGSLDAMLSGRAGDLDELREQNKWLSLAKFGVALMGSNTGNIGTDIGVAGQSAINAFGRGLEDITDREQQLEDMRLRMAMAQMGGGGGAAAAGLEELGPPEISAGTNRVIEHMVNQIDMESDMLTRTLSDPEQTALLDEAEISAMEQKLAMLAAKRLNIVSRFISPYGGDSDVDVADE